MKLKTKNLKGLLILILASALFVGCGSGGSKESASEQNQVTTTETSKETEKSNEATGDEVKDSKDLASMSFDEMVEEAKGSTVSFYGWGGDDTLNAWLDSVYSDYLKKNYDIDLERVPMDINDILSQLSNEKQAGKEDGDIDMVWINGENFKTASENDLIYGPFLDKLPNSSLLDEDDPENSFDFGYPIEGKEAPYGKAQFVFIKDQAIVEETPKNAQDLLDLAKAYPGKLSYPALPDFTGSAFVRNIVYEFVDPEIFQNMEADKETVKEAIQPALAYLRDLNPYLWNEGKSFPTDQPQLNNMFMDGEVVMTMTYGAFDAAMGIENGEHEPSSQTFIFDKGTIGNTNYMAVAKNSSNKAGALVAINAMMSPEMQLSRYENLKVIPVLDNSALDASTQEAFEKVDLGQGVLSQEVLLEKRLPEMPAGLVPIIEEIWLEEVVGQYNQ